MLLTPKQMLAMAEVGRKEGASPPYLEAMEKISPIYDTEPLRAELGVALHLVQHARNQNEVVLLPVFGYTEQGHCGGIIFTDRSFSCFMPKAEWMEDNRMADDIPPVCVLSQYPLVAITDVTFSLPETNLVMPSVRFTMVTKHGAKYLTLCMPYDALREAHHNYSTLRACIPQVVPLPRCHLASCYQNEKGRELPTEDQDYLHPIVSWCPSTHRQETQCLMAGMQAQLVEGERMLLSYAGYSTGRHSLYGVAMTSHRMFLGSSSSPMMPVPYRQVTDVQLIYDMDDDAPALCFDMLYNLSPADLFSYCIPLNCTEPGAPTVASIAQAYYAIRRSLYTMPAVPEANIHYD